jgi:hypothetical protein
MTYELNWGDENIKASLGDEYTKDYVHVSSFINV